MMTKNQTQHNSLHTTWCVFMFYIAFHFSVFGAHNFELAPVLEVEHLVCLRKIAFKNVCAHAIY